MDQAACRTLLTRLIGEETSALEELARLLDVEHGHLQANDAAALQQAMRNRQGCVTRILRVDEERRQLCRSLGRPNDLKGLEQVMRWCDPDGTLVEPWRRCAEVAARAQKLNDRNGSLVGARLKHVQDRLSTLLAGRRSMHTYGRRGISSAADSGTLIAAEA